MNVNQNAIVYVVIALLVVGRFLARELRVRRFDVRRIYALPGFLAVVAVGLVGFAATSEPEARVKLAIASVVALALGAAIGYAVAHFTTVRVKPEEPSIVYARGSAATVAIWIGALALRVLARYAFATGGIALRSESLALNAALFVLLASALFFVRFRLLAAAKIERERGITSAIAAV